MTNENVIYVENILTLTDFARSPYKKAWMYCASIVLLSDGQEQRETPIQIECHFEAVNLGLSVFSLNTLNELEGSFTFFHSDGYSVNIHKKVSANGEATFSVVQIHDEFKAIEMNHLLLYLHCEQRDLATNKLIREQKTLGHDKGDFLSYLSESVYKVISPNTGKLVRLNKVDASVIDAARLMPPLERIELMGLNLVEVKTAMEALVELRSKEVFEILSTKWKSRISGENLQLTRAWFERDNGSEITYSAVKVLAKATKLTITEMDRFTEIFADDENYERE